MRYCNKQTKTNKHSNRTKRKNNNKIRNKQQTKTSQETNKQNQATDPQHSSNHPHHADTVFTLPLVPRHCLSQHSSNHQHHADTVFTLPPRWPSGKASASRAEDPGFESRLRWDFSGSSHTSDSKIGTPVATLPGAWRYRVSAGTGRPGVSIL